VSIFSLLLPKQFGKLPSGKRLQRIRHSPNYRNGAFQNINPTPDFTDGATFFTVARDFLLKKEFRTKPMNPIPHVKTNLKELSNDANLLVWFGHSSYFIQIDGKRILVDPVFSGYASPFSFTTKAFEGSNVYSADDLPSIDYLFLTHDHYDHLDYDTILQLKPKIKQVICALGTGEHLEHWGYDASNLIEQDWNEQVVLPSGFIVTAVPARHFSGRTFNRNQSLWTAFVVQTPSMRLFLGGDSGYDTHFKEIGNRFGGFDLAILENGQYNKNWKHIHTLPSEFLQTAIDLQAKRILPVHAAKFKLSNHAWDEPLSKVMENNQITNLDILTPKIGEPIRLLDTTQTFSPWWKEQQ